MFYPKVFYILRFQKGCKSRKVSELRVSCDFAEREQNRNATSCSSNKQKHQKKKSKKMDAKFRYSFQNSTHAVCGLWLTWANVTKNNDQVVLVSFTQSQLCTRDGPWLCPRKALLVMTSRPFITARSVHSSQPCTTHLQICFVIHVTLLPDNGSQSGICRPGFQMILTH